MQVWAVRGIFFVQSMAFGAWLPRIPDYKVALAADTGDLGLALAGLPAGSMIGFAFAARFAEALGPRRACMMAGPLLALTFVPVGLADSLAWLFATLFVSGIAVALIEVGMSSKAGQMEQTSGRRMMSVCHGFWSIGSVVGALTGGILSQLGLSPLGQFATLYPVLAVAAFIVAALAPPDPAATRVDRSGGFALPAGPLVVLCILPVGIMATEGAVMDWSAVFVREVLAGGPIAAASAYAVFSTLMAASRLSADRLAERFGARNVIVAASASAAAGLALFALAPNLPLALAGAALMGAGVAPVFPLVVSAAAAAPGRSSEANVTAASFVAFVVFLATPPLVGGLAEVLGLRGAFLALVPTILLTAAVAFAARFANNTAS